MFEFELGDGRDVITDFENGTDRLELDDFSRAQVQRIINQAEQRGDDLVLRLNGSTSVSIQDMQKSDLDLSDFTF